MSEIYYGPDSMVCDHCGKEADFTILVDVTDRVKPHQDWCLDCVREMRAGKSTTGQGIHIDRE